MSFILIIAFIFFVVIVRLLFLQFVDSKKLQIRAVEQWVRTLPLTAKRGEILDTNGNVLALTETSFDVYVRAKEIENPKVVASYLSSVLNLDYDKVYEKAIDKFISESLVKLQVSEDTAKKILEKGYKGIYVTENIKRYYPYGKALSQTLGFLTSDATGQSGLESYYNSILKGENGKFLTQSDVRGVTLNNSLNYYIEQVDGIDLKLNIDINIQVIAEKVLEQIENDHHPKSASIVVFDPQTSKILSLAITPGFDLNNIPRDDVSLLMTLSKNIAVTDVYEPGSTFKILTLCAALEENLTNIDETFNCPGYRYVDGEKIKCWKTKGHGTQTLVEAVQNSCNCCFMDLGLRLGKERLYKYLKAFGIGEKTDIDFSGESGGILLNIDKVQNVDLARISFGQTVAVSQLQLLNAFCSAINGGILNTPRLLDCMESDEKTIYSSSVLTKNITISSKTSETIKYLLEKSLSKTGDMTFIEGYKVGGKTGTAQKYGEDGKISQGKYVSSFFGFLNSKNTPQYATLICVDEASSGAYYGSVVAKPYAKTLFEQIISLKNLKKDDENVKEEFIIVPDLISKSVEEVSLILDKLKVYYEIDGDGDMILNQFPLPNTKISKSTTILLKTN